MTAVLGGLGAALAWSAGTLAATRATRGIGPWTALAGMLAVGLLLIAPFVAREGIPAELDATSAGWLFVSGAGNVIGVALVYMALRSGLVGLIAAIVATEGALAALISIAAGEPMTAWLGIAIAVVTSGVVVTAGSGRTRASGPITSATPLVLAGAAACLFAVSLYATGRASELPTAWVVLSARLIGVLAITLPLLVLGRLERPGRAWPLLVIAGAGEVLGFASFTFGSRDSIAIAAVCAAPGAVFSAVGAFLLFGERLTRGQVAGIVITIAGVAATGALSA